MSRLMTAAAMALTCAAAPAEEAAFTAKPTVEQADGTTTIRFSVNQATDVAVSVLDAKGVVVRHLAAGVLGENTPEPLQKNALTQSLMWDCRDDLGKPVPPGTYSVRVGLGLKPRLKTLENFEPLHFGAVLGLAALPDGGVCVYSQRAYPDFAPVILALDSDGTYRRSLYPPPATVDPAKSPGAPGFVRGDGKWVLRLDARMSAPNDAPKYTPMAAGGGSLYVCPQTVGGIYAIHSMSGAVSERVGKEGLGWGKNQVAPRALAVSADGRWLYFTAVTATKRKYKAPSYKPLHAVYRMPVDGGAPPSPFFGKPAESGTDALLNAPLGLAVGEGGNLYVCDNGNNRVIVVKPDGTPGGSFEVPGAALCAPDADSGRLFVVCSSRLVGGHPGVPLGKAKVEVRAFTAKGEALGVTAVSGSRGVGSAVVTGLATEAVNGETRVWLSLAGRKWPTTGGALLRYSFDGKAFATLKAISTNYQKPFMKGPYDPRSFYNWGGQYQKYDEVLDWKYLPDEGRLHYSLGPLSGKKNASWADGRRYRWNMGNSWYKKTQEPIWRKLALLRLDPAGRPLAYKATGTNGLKLVHQPRAPWWAQRGVMVDRRGHVYMRYTWEDVEAKKKDMDSRNVWATGIQHFDEKGHHVGEVVMTHGTYGMGVDVHGNIYVGDKPRPAGIMVPADVKKAFGGKVPSGLSAWYGSVIKFGPQGGGFVFRKGRPKEAEPRRPGDLYRPPLKNMFAGRRYKGGEQAQIEGAEWVWPGMSPLVGTGGCICYGTSLAVDPHGRVFAPDKMACRVAVLDACGNLIRYIGSYGNMDSRGKGSPVPDPEIAFAAIRMVTFATSRQVRVADNWNMWVSVINLDYETERRVPLTVK